jgi:hypothetical protein
MSKSENRRATSKDRVLWIRVNSRESTALGALASREGRNRSDMVRELIRREAMVQGVWPTGESSCSCEESAA